MVSIESEPVISDAESEQKQLLINPDDLLYVSGVSRLIGQEGLTREVLVTHLENRKKELTDLFGRSIKEPQQKEVAICEHAVGVLSDEGFTTKNFKSLIETTQKALKAPTEENPQKRSLLNRLFGR